MDRDTYNEITRLVQIPVGAELNMRLLLKLFPRLSEDTLLSLLAQENQYKTLKGHHVHKSKIPEYCHRYRKGEDVMELCAAVDFPPCLLMRRMIEYMLDLNKQQVSEALRDPSLLLKGDHGDVSSELLARLQEDLRRCVLTDRSYSPLCDAARSLAGLEYEELLIKRLKEIGASFWTEEELRAQGMFKTPDVRLQVPLAVRDPHRGDYRVVTWIDSKATFGDDRTHQQQLEGQYRTYVNRYGPGLVIYWFGFITDLDNDEEVMLTDRFPEGGEIIQLPQAGMGGLH